MEVKQASKKTLTHLPERPTIDIEFQDLTYSVTVGSKESKVILKDVNGTFKAGQLTAILGPSGAGKSTLLNILAGYKCTGASGLITTNGKTRVMKQFRKMSRYIMQEDIVQPFLTVEECMLIAADLKLSRELFNADKSIAITEVLDMLNLLKHKSTRTERLSGGEKKRLSIALELINNPPVIFLDEPTTGLDDAAALQCVSLLKMLAQGGRTVVCSIHTPSAKVFAFFDQVYILSQGQCVFQGVGADIVPFLGDIGLHCPTHYNPADFIIDVASGEYGYHMDKLVALTNNGRKACSISRAIESQHDDESAIELSRIPYDVIDFNKDIPEYDCSTWKQFKIILYRMYRQKSRDIITAMIMFMYLFLAVAMAMIFYNVGNNAAMAFSNFCFMYNSMLTHMYCAVVEAVLNFPMQVELIKREHFNRWYRLEAYLWARTVFTIPIQLVCSTIYTVVVFGPTSQPLEAERMLKFILVCVLIALISESVGMCLGTAMNVVNGMFLAQVLMSPLYILAGYGFGYDNIPMIVLIIIRADYLRYGVEGLTNAIFENREKIPCPDTSDFCMFTNSKDMMKFWNIENSNYWLDVAVLFAILVFIKIVSLFMLRQRLSQNKTSGGLKLVVTFVKNRIISSR